MIHPNHSRRSAGLLLLIGLLFVAARASMAQPSQGGPAAGGPARAASAAQPGRHTATTPAANAADGPTLTGVLSVVWGDGQDGRSTTAFYLGVDGGRSRELLVRPGMAAALLPLNGRRVAVQPAGDDGARRDNAPPGSAAPLPVASVVAIDPPAGDRAADAPTLDGTLPYLSLLCAFPDGEEVFEPAAFYRDMYGAAEPRLDHYWDDLSYGAVSMAGSDTAGPFTLPLGVAAYGVPANPDLSRLATDCIAAADPTVDFSRFHGVNLIFNNHLGCCAWGGGWYGVVDGSNRSMPTSWLPPWAWRTLSVVAHEIGHTFGLPHSSGPYGNVYDNPYDVMSDGEFGCFHHDRVDPTYSCIPPQTIGYHKHRLGWLGPDDVAVVGAGETVVELDTLSAAGAGRPRLVIARVVGDDQAAYTLEARARVGYDAGLPGAGVIIHRVARYGSSDAILVDGDYDGDTYDAGAYWTPGEVFAADDDGITITINAKTPTGYRVTIKAVPPPLFTDCAAQTKVGQSECEALVALYQQTSGPDWRENNGWMTRANPCSWYGVVCRRLQQPDAGQEFVVTELNLHENDLAGPLPPQLFTGMALRRLYLFNNKLTGPLPAGMERALAMEQLGLGINQLTGPIPPEVGRMYLYHLDLFGNQLSGPLPAELGEMPNLGQLWLGSNQLTGPIPPQLGHLTALQYLDLANNKLSGPIPPQLGDMTELQYLWLNDNGLSGPIPPQLGEPAALRTLMLQNNQLSGSIPSALGQLAALEQLELWNNQLSGPIPSSLGDLASLEELVMHNNQLSGPIPPSLGQLARLTRLGLFGNQLSGPVPPQLGDLAALRFLDLERNQLSGELPGELGQMAALEQLWLGGNKLTGQLPAELGRLSALRVLTAQDNGVVGLVPAEWGQATGLEYLDLSNTSLVGALPHTFQNLSALQGLFINGTGLCLPPDEAFQAWAAAAQVYADDGATCATSLAGSYRDGAPGSVFAVRGVGFVPGASASVRVNGRPSGQVTADGYGELFFLLDTAGAAGPGRYEVVVTTGEAWGVLALALDDGRPSRASRYAGPVLSVPSGTRPLVELFLGVVVR